MLKYKVFTFLLFTLCFMSFYTVNGKENSLPLLGKVIYIDPGHGGRDPGAMYKNIMEKDINLSISKKLKNNLENLGAIVYMTRYDDYDLSVKYTNSKKRSDLANRIEIINNSNTDMYISIHLNAENSENWRGVQIFYDDINPKNKELANTIYKEFKNNFSTTREVKELTNIYLHRKVEKLGILVEAGFLSNANDRYLLKQKTHQQALSNIITEGILKYYKLS